MCRALIGTCHARTVLLQSHDIALQAALHRLAAANAGTQSAALRAQQGHDAKLITSGREERLFAEAERDVATAAKVQTGDNG